MSLDAYFCKLPGRTYGMSWDPPDPGEYVVPCGVFIAETRGQAKRMLLAEHDRSTDPEEFLDVRTRLLERDVADAPAGSVSDHDPHNLWDGAGDPPAGPYYRLWGRVHEVEDHGGRPCDCPPYIEDAA